MPFVNLDRRALLAGILISAGSGVLATPRIGRFRKGNPADYGPIGQGNDFPALRDAFADNAGGIVTLDPQRVYRLAVGESLTLASGTTLETRGAGFEFAAELSGTKSVFIAEDALIDGDLVMHITAGGRANRLFTANGTDVTGHIQLTSDDHQANGNRKNREGVDQSLRSEDGDNAHGALRIRSSLSSRPVRLGDVSVSSFDFAVTATKFSQIELGDIKMQNSLRGFRIEGGDVVVHGDVHTRGRSPNGQEGHIPGQNSYLFANVRRITGGFLDLADNFEHCLRQGGDAGERRMEQASFRGVRTLRSGQSGIKLSNSANDTGTISLGQVEVSAAGYRENDPEAQPGRNEAGILAEAMDELLIDSYILRSADGRRYSCNVGLDLRVVRRCRVGRLDGADTDGHLVSAEAQTSLDGTTFTAPLDSLEIDSLAGRNIGGAWLRLNYSEADIGAVRVAGECNTCGEPLVRVRTRDPGGSGGVTGPVEISVRPVNLRGTIADVRSTSPLIEITETRP